MTTPAQSAAYQFTRDLDSQARNSEEKTAGAYFRGSLFVSAKVTKAGHTNWKVGIHGKVISYFRVIEVLADREQTHLDEEAKGLFVDMVAEAHYCVGHAPTVTLKGRVDLHLKGTYHYFGLGAMPRGQKGRQVHAGPEVEGPWAYAFGLATVISASAAHREADAKKRSEAIEVEQGTILRIDNVSYRVDVLVGGEHIRLTPVQI